MLRSSFLSRFRWSALTYWDLLVRSALRTGRSRKNRQRRHPVLLQVTPLEDRTLLSNVLGYLGQDLNETALSPANVSTATFGKAFTAPLDGTYIDAQPLYVSGVNIPGQGTHNVLYVATTGGNLYAMDANSGTLIWQRSFVNSSAGITAVNLADLGNGGTFGIRGTPVIAASTGTLFVVTFPREQSGTFYDYFYRMHAIDITTGQDKVAPATIGEASEPVSSIPGTGASWVANWNIISGPSAQGTGDGSVNGTIQFNTCAEYQTAALTVANGSVYVCFSGLVEGFGPYHGWVLGYSAQTLQPTAVWNDT